MRRLFDVISQAKRAATLAAAPTAFGDSSADDGEASARPGCSEAARHVGEPSRSRGTSAEPVVVRYLDVTGPGLSSGTEALLCGLHEGRLLAGRAA
ncbi:hypothetical protein [Actinomadura rugatobispora]|uniref:Uncharacterized protein n=1 Tax=Actinomadura rugatobispora TaxID=1994 RepID=A0ABW0ZY04_9ACTN|nr:hypothetical protein GCM10010200_041200 [Actinomadura rugatobispora]